VVWPPCARLSSSRVFQELDILESGGPEWNKRGCGLEHSSICGSGAAMSLSAETDDMMAQSKAKNNSAETFSSVIENGQAGEKRAGHGMPMS